MEKLHLKAYAKINLSLDILDKRSDGYHNIKTIMQTINLFDGIYIKKTDDLKITITSTCKWLPVDEKNLVYKAIDLIMKNYKIKNGVSVDIRKRIPISAGLAGGSSDCAAALKGIKTLFNLPIKNHVLMEMGKSLGADVPFCLLEGTALAEGIGEILTQLPPHPSTYIVLARPPVKVSTAETFKSYSKDKVKNHPNVDNIITALRQNNVPKIAKNLTNVLESVTERDNPIITEIKNVFYEQNALGTLMSGSGPTVFAYFSNKEDASLAVDEIKKIFPQIHEIFLTTTYNPL